MLKFVLTNIIFACIAVLIVLLIEYCLIWLLVLLLIYISLLSYGVFCVCSGLFIKTYCKAENVDKLAAMTFDDGINSIKTPVILDILNDNGIKATFFIIGESIANNEELLKRIDSDGHLIGNHTNHHSYKLLYKSTKFVYNDILTVKNHINNIIGKEIRFFRPPFGFLNPQFARALKQLNFKVIGWSLRTLDTVRKPEIVARRLKSKLHPGCIILLHDNRQNTVEHLAEYIEIIKSEGYTFVRLDTLLGLDAYAS